MAPPKSDETRAVVTKKRLKEGQEAAEKEELAKAEGKPKGITDGKSEIDNTLPLATLARS